MLSSLLLTTALFAPAAPMPRDTTPNPSGPPPQLLYFSKATGNRVANANAPVPAAMDIGLNLTTYETKKVQIQQMVPKNVNGKVQFERVKKEVDQQIPTSKRLGERNEVFITADGSKLSKDEALKRLSAGAVALISTDGMPVDPAWLRIVDRDTITIHSSEIKGKVTAGYSRGPKTPAPRLVLLAPDMDGKIRLTATPAPAAADGANVIVAGNGAAQIIVRANINGVPVQVDGNAPANASEKKSLETITFEAYTAKGESVSKADVLTRLKAGGMVAIAGSNQKPDDVYLQAFSPDLLVIVSQELVQSGRAGFSSGMMPGGLGGAQIQIQALPAQIVPAAPEKEEKQEEKK